MSSSPFTDPAEAGAALARAMQAIGQASVDESFVVEVRVSVTTAREAARRRQLRAELLQAQAEQERTPGWKPPRLSPAR
ncbi:hypothetical protein [Streptomyces rubiginosohelvolus]|uniref:Uncharacterized protein n=1 Tax=Streptomyces rubiginosohelvolus TaxID=67362 RepID=A0ABQ3CBK3_9ACTN|nr:hypothetical protein [Streptomyces pluricolorescens]GGZ83001.1 hypothetical protein GCM10010328_66760 [Streptomyces pluricolorescens]